MTPSSDKEDKLRQLFLLFGKRPNGSSSIADGSERNSSFASTSSVDQGRIILEAIEYNRATAELGTHFSMAFIALGLVTLCINLTILAILATHKRLVASQIFYLLIINFAIIDVFKGICLASHTLRFVVPQSVYQDRKELATHIDQYVNIFFRLFNLATIFNLLMITLNEFVYIKFPLRYHQLIRRRLVVGLICLSWIICILFTVCSSVAKTKDDTVFISDSYDNYTENISSVDWSYTRDQIKRSDASDTMDLHAVFQLALTGFSLFSLFVVLVCYAIFFFVIRQIQMYDRRLMGDANYRRTFELSVEQQDMQNLEERKIKRQLLKRYKYVLVIGSVILVYMLYLISYSSIQILGYFTLRSPRTKEEIRSSAITRWILVLLCGLHSSVQPICYFRMREFREIVAGIFQYSCKCGRVVRGSCGGGQRHESRSSQQFSSMADMAPLTASQCATPLHYAKTAPLLVERCQNEELKITPCIRQSSYTNLNGTTKPTKDPKHSVVHFEEGQALLVSTLTRRQSGFLSGNEML